MGTKRFFENIKIGRVVKRREYPEEPKYFISTESGTWVYSEPEVILFDTKWEMLEFALKVIRFCITGRETFYQIKTRIKDDNSY